MSAQRASRGSPRITNVRALGAGEMDRRIAELVGAKRYPVTVLHAETMTDEQRAKYGLTDWIPRCEQ